MKKVVLGLAAAASLALAGGAAQAQGMSDSSWYVKGFGGATWPQDQSGAVKDGSTKVGTGKQNYDTGYTLGASVGWEYSPNVAFELEYSYRQADSTTKVNSIDLKENGKNSTNAVLVNALYKFDGMGSGSPWTPYVGGGLGWANVESDIDTLGTFKRDSAFAWQLMGGVEYDINPNWALLGEVRYFATDSGKLKGPNSLSWDGQVETIDLLVGAAYKF